MTKYKDEKECAKTLSVSTTSEVISFLTLHAAEFDTDRSKLVAALIKYMNVNKKNKNFIYSVQEILKNG